jgi:hypothetical protein
MNGPLEWFGAIGTILAAGTIAADLGRRATGWAFVLFVLVSMAWVASGVINGTPPLAVQNLIMVGVNAWGVWQYLLNPKKRTSREKAKKAGDANPAESEREAGEPA